MRAGAVGRGLQCLGAPSSVLHQLCSPLVPVLVAGAHDAMKLGLSWSFSSGQQRAKMVAKQTQYHLKTELCSVAISEQFRHGEFSSAS